MAGAVFAGIAAVLAQCATTASGATGGASALLGFFFLVRAAGDLADNGLGWLSPLGWCPGCVPLPANSGGCSASLPH